MGNAVCRWKKENINKVQTKRTEIRKQIVMLLRLRLRLFLLYVLRYLDVTQRKSLKWINSLGIGPYTNINQNMKTLKHISKIANKYFTPTHPFEFQKYLNCLHADLSPPSLSKWTPSDTCFSVLLFISLPMQHSYKVISKWNQIILRATFWNIFFFSF